MARVILIEKREGIADEVLACVRASSSVELCERVTLPPGAWGADWPLSRDIDTVVYSPGLPSADGMTPDLDEAEVVLKRCAAAPTKHFVLVSSALIYGATPHNQGLIPESRQPVCLNRSQFTDKWKALEALATEHLDNSTQLTVLRPATVLSRDNSDYLSLLLRRRTAVVLAGHDPSLQFLSPEDFARAVRCVVERSTGGIYNVAPDMVITLRGALRQTHARRVPFPRSIQRLSHAAHQLDLIRYSWTVSNNKIKRDLGFEPEHSSGEALARYVGGDNKRQAVNGAEALEAFDDFGMDRNYIDAYCRTMFKVLFKYYWRVEHRGLRHIPKKGRAVMIGVHRGFMPWDAVMTLYLIVQKLGRYPRCLIHPSLIKFPFLFNFHTKLGGIIACQENADYVLERDKILTIFPEGIRGAFSRYPNPYRLKKFRDDYVKIALRHGAPIVPFVTVGSAEIFPIFARIDWGRWKRWTEWPYFPITPTWPLLPVPLPTKWHTEFLEPIHIADRYPPEAANDPATVRAISEEVKARLAEAIDALLHQRKSIWFGSMFGDETIAEEETLVREEQVGS